MNRVRYSTAGFLAILLAVFAPLLHARQAQPPASKANAAEDALRGKIVQYLRLRFSVSNAATITVGPFRPSLYPDYYLTTVTLTEGKQTASQDFFVSHDGHYLLQGNIYTLGADPAREVEAQISTESAPSLGPASAPVTIVEYADLECSVCAQMQTVLTTDVAPRYGNRVRIVFKEFPLGNIHPWALEAAIAEECAYQTNPAAFLAYRSAIYTHQTAIKPDTARAQLLDIGVRAGLDGTKLAACVDAQSSMPRVRKDFLEGQRLGVGSTPTLFVNGRLVTGLPKAEDLYQIIDTALKQGK